MKFQRSKLIQIIQRTISFKIPLKKIDHHSIYSLELFHGPTLAFKDVGKFLAYVWIRLKMIITQKR